MSFSGRIITLKDISVLGPKPGNKWREVRIDEEDQGWHFIWRNPIEKRPANLVYEEGKSFTLKIRVKRFFRFWPRIAELEVTDNIVSEALASSEGTYTLELDGGFAGTLVLHFSKSDTKVFEPDSHSKLDSGTQLVTPQTYDHALNNPAPQRPHVGRRPSRPMQLSIQSVPLERVNSEDTRSEPDSIFDTDSNCIEEPESANTEDFDLGQEAEMVIPTRGTRKDSVSSEGLLEMPGILQVLANGKDNGDTDAIPGNQVCVDPGPEKANEILSEELDSPDAVSNSSVQQDILLSDTTASAITAKERDEAQTAHTPFNTARSDGRAALGRSISLGHTVKTTHLNLERQKEDRQVLAEAKESYFSRYVEKNGESAFESPPNDSGIQLRRVYSAQDQRGDYVNALSSFSRSSALRMEKELSSSSSLVHEEEQLQGELPNIEDRHPISGNISEANGLFPSVTNGVDYAGHDVPSSLDLSADSTNVDGARSGREEFRPTNHKVVAHVSILMEAELGNAKKLLNTDRTDSAPIRRLKQVNDYLQVFLRFGLALSELNPVAKAIMASVVEIVKIVQSRRKIREEMLDLLDAMSRALPLLAHVDQFGSAHRLKKAMEQVYDIMTKAVKYATRWGDPKASRTRVFLRVLVDKDRSKADGLKKEFETFIDEYDRGVNVEALLTVQEIHRGLQELHYRTQDHLDTEILNRIRDSYARADPMNVDFGDCIKGTRENVIQDIMDWVARTNSPRILWIRSMPGAGKSTIARTIVRRLSQQNRHGAYFYFSRDDPSKQTPFALWCHILYSLSCHFPVFKRTAAAHLRLHKFDFESLNTTDISDAVIQTLSSLTESEISQNEMPIIVIDALDECPKCSPLGAGLRQSVLDVISKSSKLSSLFKIIVTSREDIDIFKVLGNEETADSIYLRTGVDVDEYSSRDICHYIRERLAGKVEPSERDLERLSRRAAGLFIWASMAVLFILDKAGRARQRFERILNDESPGQLSDELSKLYHLLLTEEFSGNPDEAVRDAFQTVVGTLVVAATPLTRNEVFDLLIGTLEKGELVSVFFPGYSFLSPILPRIPASTEIPSSILWNRVRAVRGILAAQCLKLMNTHLSCLPSLHQHHEEHIPPSLRYAAQHWATHMVKGTLTDISVLLTVFFDEHLLHWLEMMSILSYMHQAIEILKSVAIWLQPTAQALSSPHLFLMVTDSVNFAMYFAECIEMFAPHVYTSALAFSPTTSYVAQHYRKPLPPFTPLLLRGHLSSWPDSLVMVPHAPPGNCMPTSKFISHEQGRKQDGRPMLKRSLTGPKNYIFCAAFTPDGKHIVTGSGDRTVRLWDLATGGVVKYTGHTARITSLAISSDGSYFASGSEDQRICVRRLDSGELVGRFLEGHTEFVMSVAFSPNGTRIVSGSGDKTLRIWEVASGTLAVDPLYGHTKTVMSVAISRDSQLIVSGSNDRSLCVWSMETGVLLRRINGHANAVVSVSFSPNGRYIVSGSRDTTTRLWSTDTGKTIRVFEGHSDAVMSVAFSPDGTEVVSGSSDRSIRVWNTGGKAPVTSVLNGHTDKVYAVAFSPDGRHIVSGSRDQSVRLWNMETHTDQVTTVAYSVGGKHVASGSHDGSVRIWNVESQNAAQHLVVDRFVGVTSLAFSPDGGRIAAGYVDGFVYVWSVDTRDTLATRSPTSKWPRAISSVAFSSDSKCIISSDTDNCLRRWAIEPADAKDTTIQLHNTLSTIPIIAFSPDEKWVVTASSDSYALHVYSVETGEEIVAFQQEHDNCITSLAISADGKYILSGSEDGNVHVWNFVLAEMEQMLVVGRPVTSITSFLDGKRIAWGCVDGSVYVWNLETDKMVCGPLEGHLQPVRSVAFSGDGQHLVTGSDDHSVRIWSLSVDDETISDAWSLSKDGWARGTEGKVLFYVPQIHRPNLYRPRNTFIFGEYATQLDTSELRRYLSVSTNSI